MQTELNKVITALHEFYAHEAFLLEKEAGERALTHRLAVHFERQFTGWEIDCEYDRLGDRTLRLPHGSYSQSISQPGNCLSKCTASRCVNARSPASFSSRKASCA